MSPQPSDEYQSFSYLRPGVDLVEFELAAELDRVPALDLSLSAAQTSRTRRLLDTCLVVSLHDHPMVIPADPLQTPPYVRAGRVHTGFRGLRISGLDVVFDNFLDGICCVHSQHGWQWNDVITDIGMRFADLAKQDHVVRVHSLADIDRARALGQLGLVAGLEAATMIESEVDRIDVLYGFGIRQMGIAYSQANGLGSGLSERIDGGLTYFGERAIDRMNRIGMAIDVSHCGERTSLDVIRASTQPVFITHAGARALWDSPRLKSDEVIRACAERGGVIGIEAAPHTTLSRGREGQSLESVMDHFSYCVDLVGIEHVAFGPDTMFGDHASLHRAFANQLSLDRVTTATGHAPVIVDYVPGLENPGECFHTIVGWLVKNGHSDTEIAAVLGGNVRRVLEQVW